MTNTFQAVLCRLNQEENYFNDYNRKWQPFILKAEPLNIHQLSPVPFLRELGVINHDRKLNPILEKAGLFISIEIMNDQIEQLIPRHEILISNLGIKFLNLLQEGILLEKAGINTNQTL